MNFRPDQILQKLAEEERRRAETAKQEAERAAAKAARDQGLANELIWTWLRDHRAPTLKKGDRVFAMGERKEGYPLELYKCEAVYKDTATRSDSGDTMVKLQPWWGFWTTLDHHRSRGLVCFMRETPPVGWNAIDITGVGRKDEQGVPRVAFGRAVRVDQRTWEEAFNPPQLLEQIRAVVESPFDWPPPK